MTTRTELIEQLRENAPWCSNATCDLQINAADMLEADEQGMKDAFASGMSCRPASVQQCDKLREAARLALDALINGRKVRNGEGGTEYQPPLEDAAITALKEVL